jgi:regulator of protease activity HflC (stomatin/prohibitin superfamily)
MSDHHSDDRSRRRTRNRFSLAALSGSALIALLILFVVFCFLGYHWCRIDVPAKHIAVLTNKTGADLANNEEIAPTAEHKGLQKEVLSEGRYFRNPYHFDWEVYPMVEIPEDKLGVRIRLYGDDLPYGDFVALNDDQKGIVEEVLRPGRYAINATVKDSTGKSLQKFDRNKSDFVEIVELHDPVTIPAGFKGVVTNLAGRIPNDSNSLLVDEGSRGVQRETLDAGTYYLNPYMYRIQAIDCRSQRFNLAENYDMGFPSKDGFWVSLDGIIEFRVKPDQAANVYVTYNEVKNDAGIEVGIDQEIIRKVIMPNARSFCRIQGSNSSGRDFIGGETRSAFQKAFQEAIRKTCEAQGIEIVQALITKINPPQAIAAPVRDREVASQQLKQFQQQKLQQDEEAKLAREIALVEQGKRLVDSDQEVVKLITAAKKDQEIALAEASRDKAVAEEALAAAKDKASAILARQRAEAAVIGFANEADAAGWSASVKAFGGDGKAYARYVLYQKMAPGFKSIMTNTADSPLMRVFDNFQKAPKDAQE